MCLSSMNLHDWPLICSNLFFISKMKNQILKSVKKKMLIEIYLYDPFWLVWYGGNPDLSHNICGLFFFSFVETADQTVEQKEIIVAAPHNTGANFGRISNFTWLNANMYNLIMLFLKFLLHMKKQFKILLTF